jgi:hypothetical protein
MNRKGLFIFVAVSLFEAMICLQTVAATDSWLEYATNPVFDPIQRAYYPSVLYDANKFSGHGDSYYYKSGMAQAAV